MHKEADAEVLPLQSRTAVMYLRVSTKEQAEKDGESEGYSIPAQREACRRKAQALHADVIEEFIDAGESAKSADRPNLQRLLEYVGQNKVDYVIVHKIDRLARNRNDDVMINIQLQSAGAQLVSCTENIDETPSGKLLHGIMASIAEFYSGNLSTEAVKGMIQKAERGGTIGKAPVGYLNVTKLVEGLEVRTVEFDPDRADLVRWVFEEYATGHWTILKLLAVATEKGLTTTPSRKRAAKPMSPSSFHGMLRNRYYIGKIRFRDVEYEGAHEHLVPLETFHAVQDILDSNRNGEKQREHPHYLKGTVFCGRCRSRLCITKSINRHGTHYFYYFCVGRQQKRSACHQPVVPVSKVEFLVEGLWSEIKLDAKYGALLQEIVQKELDVLHAKNVKAERSAKRQLDIKREQRRKLLDAYYAGALALKVFKAEQQTLTNQIETHERRLAKAHIRVAELERVLSKALEFLYHPQETYREAPEKLRRQLNQAVWNRIEIHVMPDKDHRATGTIEQPFAALLDPELLQPLREAVGGNPGESGWSDGKPEWFTRMLKTETAPRSLGGLSSAVGLKDDVLAPPTGFEPVLPP